jgi:hypothetical protein
MFIYLMLIGAVEYAMDPANNRVVYSDSSPPRDPTTQYYYLVDAFGIQKEFSTNAAAAEDACKRNAQGYGWKYISSTPATWTQSESGIKFASCIILRDANIGNETFEFVYQRVVNPAYDPSAQSQNKPKYLPYDVVASQIISDAAAEKAEGKAYVSSVADTSLEDEQNQIVPSTQVIEQLENTQSIPTTETSQGQSIPKADPTDPTVPKAPPTDIKLNFPIFCSWAPTVCQAAQAAIEFPKTAAGWWKTLDTWLTSLVKDDVTEPQQPDYEIQEPDLNLGVQQYISGEAFCPEDRHIPLSMGGQSLDIIISYSALCTVAQQFRPAVILMSFLAGAFIITNTGRRAETGD